MKKKMHEKDFSENVDYKNIKLKKESRKTRKLFLPKNSIFVKGDAIIIKFIMLDAIYCNLKNVNKMKEIEAFGR